MGRVAEGLLAEDGSMDRRCTFRPPSRVDQSDSGMVNLSQLLEEAVLQLKKDVPLEQVVNMFQQLVRASSFDSARIGLTVGSEPTAYIVLA